VGDGREMTYRELSAAAGRLARRLRALGAGPGVPVAVVLERSAEMVPALLAVLEAGSFYVPLDPAHPEARSRAILETLGAEIALTQERLAPRLAKLGVPRLVLVDGAEAEAEEPSGGAAAAASPAEPDDPAYVIFTSGSTGAPKGVVVRHRPAVHLIHWVNGTFGVGPGDRLLFATALTFDLSVYDVFGILAGGGTVRVASEAEVRDPEALARVLAGEPITFWDSAPAALSQLVPFFPRPAAGRGEGALRLVFLSGDWIPLGLPAEVRAAFPRAQVVALGGATVATVWSNFHRVDEIDPQWLSIPYGRPIPNARYLVLDERLEPCPAGVPGDLYIGGE
jgi:amino acid adenylation domain-containing protein